MLRAMVFHLLRTANSTSSLRSVSVRNIKVIIKMTLYPAQRPCGMTLGVERNDDKGKLFLFVVFRQESALPIDLFFFFDTIFSDGKIEAKRGFVYEKHF